MPKATTKPSTSKTSKPAKKTTPKKPVNNTKAAEALHTPRRVKAPMYKPFRFQKAIKNPHALPSSWKIFKQSVKTVWASKKLFLGIVVVYGLLNIILVQGFGNTSNIQSVKTALNGSNGISHVIGGLSLFAGLVASSGNSGASTSGVYQVLLVILVSLVIIWSLRQVIGGVTVRVRDAFYKGTFPLVQFILVLVVITLQLVPAAIGAGLYSLVSTSGIASHGYEKFAWAVLAFFLVGVSLFMLCSSLFALYIVALPNMTPMKALRSARGLVRYRRWTIVRKILFLPLILFIVSAIIVVPIILTITAAASWTFFVLSMIGIVMVHAYMYTLYRELLL